MHLLLQSVTRGSQRALREWPSAKDSWQPQLEIREAFLWWGVTYREKKAVFSLLWEVCLNPCFSYENPRGPGQAPWGTGLIYRGG